MISEPRGHKPIQFSWPGPGVNPTYLISSDLFEALKLSLGTKLVVIRDGKNEESWDTTGEMLDLNRHVMGAERNLIKGYRPNWCAHQALIKKEFRSKMMFPMCFALTLKRIKEIT